MGVVVDLFEIIDVYIVVIDKSIVFVGMVEKVYVILFDKFFEDLFDVVFNLEFFWEGVAVDDFMCLDWVVVGMFFECVKEVMFRLYEFFVCQGNFVYFMDECFVEMIKYVVNFYLVICILFMNEIVNFCEKVGVNVDMV